MTRTRTECTIINKLHWSGLDVNPKPYYIIIRSIKKLDSIMKLWSIKWYNENKVQKVWQILNQYAASSIIFILFTVFPEIILFTILGCQILKAHDTFELQLYTRKILIYEIRFKISQVLKETTITNMHIYECTLYYTNHKASSIMHSWFPCLYIIHAPTQNDSLTIYIVSQASPNFWIWKQY